MCNTKVDKVIIENGRAVGVRVVPTKPLTPDQDHGTIIKVRKQIIVSCGTLSSPLVLQRSGVGDPEKLKAVGVGYALCIWGLEVLVAGTWEELMYLSEVAAAHCSVSIDVLYSLVSCNLYFASPLFTRKVVLCPCQ
jgi:choline dehydrogenase-like flavoprotein